MILSVSGYNWSGSSAAMDLLKEYEETTVIMHPEWYFIDQPDGIRDLEFHLSGYGTYFGSDVAIQRFIKYCEDHKDYQEATKGIFLDASKRYIDSIIQVKWKGYSVYDRYRLSKSERRIWDLRHYSDILLHKLFHVSRNSNAREMYLSVCPQNFLEKTQDYIEELIYAAGGGREKVNVVKHLFPANNPEPSFKYVKDPYVIIVDRDPRDIFVQCKAESVACFPSQDVEKFVEYYKSWRFMKNENESNRILRIQFEDLVYHYEETVERIEKFVGIEKHIFPKKYFIPEESKKTTRLYCEKNEFQEEIKYIEDTIPEYLYSNY